MRKGNALKIHAFLFHTSSLLLLLFSFLFKRLPFRYGVPLMPITLFLLECSIMHANCVDAKSMVGLSLFLDSSQSLTAAEYFTSFLVFIFFILNFFKTCKYSKRGSRSERNPLWWLVCDKIAVCCSWNTQCSWLEFGVGPKGPLREHGDVVSRQFILTWVSLVATRDTQRTMK